MMPCTYISLSGASLQMDLDAVTDIVSGPSARRAGWSALIVYEPKKRAFVELRDSPQDARGNSASEAEEVEPSYVQQNFGLSSEEITQISRAPGQWRHVNRGQRNA